MIYLTLLLEFVKIGTLAIGGGMVTIPFLIELAEKYGWYSSQELTDIIAVSQSAPGAVGVNMATYVGFNVGGIGGGLIAVLGLVLPALVSIIIISKYLFCEKRRAFLQNILFGVRPMAVAMILQGGYVLAKLSIVNYLDAAIALVTYGLIRSLKWHPIVFIIMGAIVGILLEL